jgi:hypothetical protein
MRALFRWEDVKRTEKAWIVLPTGETRYIRADKNWERSGKELRRSGILRGAGTGASRHSPVERRGRPLLGPREGLLLFGTRVPQRARCAEKGRRGQGGWGISAQCVAFSSGEAIAGILVKSSVRGACMIWYRPLREALVEILIKFSLRGPCMILYGSLWEDFADIRVESFARGPCMILHSSFCEDPAEIRVEPSLVQVFLWRSCEDPAEIISKVLALHDLAQVPVRRPCGDHIGIQFCMILYRPLCEDLGVMSWVCPCVTCVGPSEKICWRSDRRSCLNSSERGLALRPCWCFAWSGTSPQQKILWRSWWDPR